MPTPLTWSLFGAGGASTTNAQTGAPTVSEIGLFWDDAGADISIAAGDLAKDGGLTSAVLLSLFTDRRAADGDVLPDDQTSRRGWWGDEFAEDSADKFGSRLWLLARAKQQPDTLSLAKGYCAEALQWLVDDLVAESVTVTTAFSGRGVLFVTVTIQRPKADPTTFRFNYNWATQEAQAA